MSSALHLRKDSLIASRSSGIEELRKVKTLKSYISIGGGKGGIGKTFVAANLAIALATYETTPPVKVTVVDTDLGGSNLNNFLGIAKPKYTLGDFLRKRADKINDVVTQTQFEHMNLLAGADDLLDIANLNHQQKLKLLNAFQRIESDFIIFDLAAGNELKTLDFFNQANIGIIVTTPEPTAVQNAYTFARNTLLRKILTQASKHELIKDITNKYIEGSLDGVKSMRGYLEKIAAADKDSAEYVENIINAYRPKLILNQLESRSDRETAERFQELTKLFLRIEMDFLGWIPYDPRVKAAVRNGDVFLDKYRKSRTSAYFYAIAKTIGNI